jgi:2-iminobutanoate/2-iminopropanoate deaminase
MTFRKAHTLISVFPQRAAINNMKTVLEAAGSGLEHIVKANIYMSNMKDEFMLMNEVYTEVIHLDFRVLAKTHSGQFFPTDPPARTCVGVAALPLGAAMEIECIAELP